MHQHLHQYHLPLQLFKGCKHPLPLLHCVLVKPHWPRLHQGKNTRLSPVPSPQEAPTPPQSQTPRCDTDGVGKTRRYFLGVLLLTGNLLRDKYKLSTENWQEYTILTNMNRNQPVWHLIRRRITSRTSIIITSIWEVNFKRFHISDANIILYEKTVRQYKCREYNSICSKVRY